ncbi:MAG TPA: bifunctional phosphopantothenoylcysteine decarboxylase/phosphopantothenate--cysteine ligase CoaBC [Solirubrobacterales bacterium]|jgi:phosphopantothenoylcysteine decarboxylase/phosphopantothenate--cysteine ligase
MARILLGVSGGIAAYKSLELARLATLAGHGVRVVMTEAAGRFVGAASFEGITGAPALTSEFERDPMRGAFPGDPSPQHDPIGHLEVAANCDAYLVAPASANTIAKLAAGMADSMLTTSFLACTAPRLVAPAMNDRMYADPATQANLSTLRERGITVIEPDEGLLASRGEEGRGRLPEPVRLLERVESVLERGASEARSPVMMGANERSAIFASGGNRPWDGLRVLVTAGGTREPIDPVRFIGNRSSGRMGLALAAAAARRGAEVTLIAANVSLPEPAGVHRIDVETAAELAEATRSQFPSSQVLLMAAAPADFRPPEVEPAKLQRDDGLELRLEPTEDILAALAADRSPGQTIVGFAAEAGEGARERAREKRTRKGVDLIVFNDVSDPAIGFESEDNAVTLIDAESESEVPVASKERIADAILDRVDGLRRPATRSGLY